VVVPAICLDYFYARVKSEENEYKGNECKAPENAEHHGSVATEADHDGVHCCWRMCRLLTVVDIGFV
jgi:hypothetical protein